MSLNGMPNNFETAYLYGDGGSGGLAGYYENIQVGGKITLATDVTNITTPANNNSIGYNTEGIVLNVKSGDKIQCTFGDTRDFYVQDDAMYIRTGASEQRLAYDELINVQASRSNLQQQIDSLAPQGRNEFWARAWGAASNQTLSAANTPTSVFTSFIDNNSNGFQLVYPLPSVGLNIVYSGVYSIRVVLEVIHPNNNATHVTAWFRNYGTDIVGTTKVFPITGQGVRNTCILTTTLKLNSGDRIEPMWMANDSGVYLSHTAAQTSPAVPACEATTIEIFQISSFSVYYANVASDAATRAEQQADYAANWAIQAQDAASTATIADTSARNYAANSLTYATQSGVYKTEAQAFAGDAVTAKNQAVAAATDASNNAATTLALSNQVFGYRNETEDFRDEAAASASSANSYSVQAEGFKNDAEGYKNDAETAATDAASSASSASGSGIAAGVSAGVAGTSAATAVASAASAATSATASAASATASAGSATSAGTSSSSASSSANTALTYRNQAQTYRDESHTYADESRGYRDESKGYSDESKGYRDEAKEYADEAGGFSNRLTTVENKTQNISATSTETVMLHTTTLGDPFLSTTNAQINSSSATFYGGVIMNSTQTTMYDILEINNNGKCIFGNPLMPVYNVTMNDTSGYEPKTIFYDKVSIGETSTQAGTYINLNHATGLITCTGIVAPSYFMNNWI